MPLPELFVQRLRKILPPENSEEVLQGFSISRPVSFRLNSLKSPAGKILSGLESAGLGLRPVAWYSDAFQLETGGRRDLQSTEAYRNGEIYLQGLSSMIPALVLAPGSGETVLDLAAAPGSKTTQMAALMLGEGKLVANDNNRSRFFKLKNAVELYGAKNAELSLRPGEYFGREMPERFDRVLVDAQCSSEARFEADNPRSFGFWKLLKIREMSRKQKRLLLSGLLALKPGGILVYSTCTFAPEENEAVLDWAVEKLGNRVEIEKIVFPIPNQMRGLAEWEGRPFHPSVRNSLRVLPDRHMEGFFVAKLRKR